MADRGLKILKNKTALGTRNPRDFYLDSENMLLKIHKQGAFSGRFFRSGGFSLDIQYPELQYRPLVLVYCQRITHDATPVLDPTYHLLDWEYHGATKEGWQRVKIYNDHFNLDYQDMIVDVPGNVNITLFGYYYVFEEKGE
jgi:hypothetical protein